MTGCLVIYMNSDFISQRYHVCRILTLRVVILYKEPENRTHGGIKRQVLYLQVLYCQGYRDDLMEVENVKYNP